MIAGVKAPIVNKSVLLNFNECTVI